MFGAWKILTFTRIKSSNIEHYYVTQNRDIFIIYRATKDKSVHENGQHVQGWNPVTIFSEIEHNGAWQTRHLHRTSNISLRAIFKT